MLCIFLLRQLRQKKILKMIPKSSGKIICIGLGNSTNYQPHEMNKMFNQTNLSELYVWRWRVQPRFRWGTTATLILSFLFTVILIFFFPFVFVMSPQTVMKCSGIILNSTKRYVFKKGNMSDVNSSTCYSFEFLLEKIYNLYYS